MRFATALLLTAIAFLSVALAQTPESSDKLASLRVTGSTRYHSDQIAAFLALRPGQPVTRDDLQKVADELAQMGPFVDVQYRFASTPAGVAAEYQVKDGPALTVSFDNFPWFSDEELTAAIKKSIPFFDGSAPEHGKLLDSIADALEALGVSGSVFAKVSHKAVRDPANDLAIQQFSAEDSDVTIGNIEFADSVAQGDPSVRSRLSDLVGKPFSRSAIGLFEFEQLRPVYVAKGYLHVRFEPPVAQLPKGTNAKAVSNVRVKAAIDPGPVFFFGGVVWSGNAVLSRGDLDKLLPLRPHDPADGMKIEALWEEVRDEYARRGYLDADVTPHAVFDDGAKGVAYSVAISEGPQYHMGKLTLSGLSAEGERRIRLAWKLPPGAVFDEKVYEDFLESGAKEAFVGLPVHYEMIGRFLDKNPSAGTVDVLLDFE